MTTVLVAFLACALAAYALTWVLRVLAPRLGAMDVPDGFRKVHDRAIPRLGGASVYVAFFIPIGLMMTVFAHLRLAEALGNSPKQLSGLVAGATVALGMGVVDDIWGLRARYKLLCQILAAVIAIVAGFTIPCVTVPFLGPVFVGPFMWPLTLFWFVGCMNAINLLDGLDGLAAGVALFVSITLMLVGLYFDHWVTVLLTACLSGSILGFLFHNFYPARIFLGDSGSNLLGFLVAALAIWSSRKSETAVALLIPIIALGLPIFDTAFAILRRWSHRLPVSAPDRQHIHHILLSLGLGHRSAVLILYIACIVLCTIAVLSMVASREMIILLILALGSMVVVSVRVLGVLRLDDLVRRVNVDWKRRESTNAAKIAIEKAIHSMDHAETIGQLWELACVPFEAMGLTFAVMRLDRGTPEAQEDGEQILLRWTSAHSTCTADDFVQASSFWHTRLPILGGDRRLGTLEVGATLENGHYVLPEIIDLVERLRGALSQAIVEQLVKHVGPEKADEFLYEKPIPQ